MIMLCPHCGSSLNIPCKYGISSCSNCNRVFDTSHFNRLLSASWLVRRKNILTAESLMRYGYAKEESELVLEAVYDNCCTHEDFIEILKAIGVSESPTSIDLDS